MNDQRGLRRYFPDRPPTWTEIVMGLLIALTIVPDLIEHGQRSRSAVLVGFLAFAVALGPAATTPLGARIGRWFRNIGVAGRLAVISGFVVAVAASGTSDAVPRATLADAGTGGLAAALLYLIVYVLVAGEVSGWLSGQDGVD